MGSGGPNSGRSYLNLRERFRGQCTTVDDGRLLLNLFARIVLSVFCICQFCSSAVCAQEPQNHKTQNIIFVMTDGLRWQEVFAGGDQR
jgi:hypothetical protein